LKILLSFDIDGTLETGDPPGPVTLDMVRRAREMGCIIGSASDRSISSQTAMWERSDIVVDFVANKHVLAEIKQRFEADFYLHLGDRELDRQFAREAEFDFMWMNEASSEPWIAIQNSGIAQVPEGTGDSIVEKGIINSSGPAGVMTPPIFSTSDCKATEKNPSWCDAHHQLLLECRRYEATLGAPQTEVNGLDAWTE
jgi:hypothetical protein